MSRSYRISNSQINASKVFILQKSELEKTVFDFSFFTTSNIIEPKKGCPIHYQTTSFYLI